MRSDQRRGTALIVAIVVTFIMVTVSMAWMSTSLARAEYARQSMQKVRCDAIAEAGLSAAIADIGVGGSGILGVSTRWNAESDDVGGSGIKGTTWGVADGMPTWGEPNVELVPFDNDGGYYTWTSEVAGDAGAYRIVSCGWQNGVASMLEAVIERIELPPFPGAIYLQWPDVDLSFNGNAFTISGYDNNWDGSDGPRDLRGVTTPWDPSAVARMIPNSREDQVTGLGGTPSTGSAPFHDLVELAAMLEGNADRVLPGGTYTASWGNPLTDEFDITYIKGDFHQSGHGTGAGVLVVDGNMRLSGSFTWYGAIIVLGGVDVVGGGGGKHTYGCIFVGDDIREVDSSSSEFTITGTSDMLYSSQSEDAIRNWAHYRMTFWNDIR